jgi:hypothetical protein
MKTTAMSNRRCLILLLAALLTSLILSVWAARTQPFYASDPYDEQRQFEKAWRELVN